MIEQEPVAPRQLNREVPSDLETMTLKCLEKEPARRYSTAQAVADECQRFMRGEPILARPVSRPARLWRWCRRNPAIASLTAAVALILVTGIVVSSTLAAIANSNANLATHRANVIDDQNKELTETNVQLTQANQREQAARLLAETNAQTAREQSQLALATLGAVVTDIQHGLKDLSGGGEVRRRLLLTSLERLEKVAAQYVSKASTDRNTLIALHELGDVVLQFGAGGPDVDETQRRPAHELSLETKSAVALGDGKRGHSTYW